MESPEGVYESADERPRRVRRRFSDSARREEKEINDKVGRTEEEELEHSHHREQRSSTLQSAQGAVPSASPFKRRSESELFFITTEKHACRGDAIDAKPSLFAEAERCWREHRATGKMHHQPPWRVCSTIEENREHPYYVQWLDTMELPPMSELLQKPPTNDVATVNKDCNDDKKELVTEK